MKVWHIVMKHDVSSTSFTNVTHLGQDIIILKKCGHPFSNFSRRTVTAEMGKIFKECFHR